ncbi:hypothetical protein RhiirA4_490697 [Rhizophagus irregularis]|uniref:Uncharacterized protein n=1 Tax=Rhizophagus irregularis TaxID=588596 RepID=A0A2I1HVU9_9GLOM|nr:hypothetical protein RhiirA4_490697 [Rhizophagus irregularis]
MLSCNIYSSFETYKRPSARLSTFPVINNIVRDLEMRHICQFASLPNNKGIRYHL